MSDRTVEDITRDLHSTTDAKGSRARIGPKGGDVSDPRFEQLARALDENGDPGVELLAGLYPSVAALEAERDRLRTVAEAARVVCVTYDSEILDRISEALPAAVDRLVAELRAHYAAGGEDFDVLFNHIDLTEPT